jgi:hypothetical protein
MHWSWGRMVAHYGRLEDFFVLKFWLGRMPGRRIVYAKINLGEESSGGELSGRKTVRAKNCTGEEFPGEELSRNFWVIFEGQS